MYASAVNPEIDNNPQGPIVDPPKGLQEWLLNREDDIADKKEDFGDLKKTFKDIVGRNPKKGK